MIREFINRSILINWDRRTLNERRLYWNAEYGNDRSETVDCAKKKFTEDTSSTTDAK